MGDDRDRCLSLGGGNCKYIPALLLRNDLRGKYLSSDSFSEAAMHGAVITRWRAPPPISAWTRVARYFQLRLAETAGRPGK
jgi:hypothetical protein